MSTPPAPAASTDETANKKVMSKQEKKLAETLEKGDLGKKGKAGDVARVISDPTGDAEMPSFLPPYLKFLDDAVPALHLRKALGPNGVIGDWQHGQAPTKAQDTVCKLKNMQMDGPGGVHALAFVGGCMLTAGALYDLIEGLYKLSPLHAFFSVVVVGFGCIMMMLEQQRALFPKRMRLQLEEFFLFLTLIEGRGAFYIYVGAIQASVVWKRSSLNVAIAFYVLVIGVLYLVVGLTLKKKLEGLKSSLRSPTSIEHAFKMYDKDQSGTLNKDEAVALTAVLGTTLAPEEIMASMDKNKDGVIDFEEFKAWFEDPKDPGALN